MLALRPAGPVRGLLGQVVRSHPEAVVDAVVQTVPDMLGAAGRDLGELDLPRGRVLDLQVVLLDGGTAVDRCLPRSEEHTSELQSRGHLVCRLLLEKKKQNKYTLSS